MRPRRAEWAGMGISSRIRAPRDRRRARRPVSTSEQLARETGLPLLAEAPAKALGGPLAPGDGWLSVNRAQLELARALAERLGSLTSGDPPRSLFVADGIESGDGVSPAVAIATASALEGRRTLLVDCDFHRRPLATGLALGDAPGIGDYLNRAARPQQLLQPLELGGRAVGRARPASLVLVGAGNGSSTPMPPPTWDRFRHFVSKVTRAYDFVVIAGEPLLAPSEPSMLMPLVDATLICARPSAVSHGQALQAGAALRHWMPRTAGLVSAT